jgi:hypothetical protein
MTLSPGIFDKMILAIDNTRGFSGFGSLRIIDERQGLIHVGNFEYEKNIIGVLNIAPDINAEGAGKNMARSAAFLLNSTFLVHYSIFLFGSGLSGLWTGK